MAWSGSLAVTSVLGNSVSAAGEVTGTDDDASVTYATVLLMYPNGVPAHIQTGMHIDVTGDC